MQEQDGGGNSAGVVVVAAGLAFVLLLLGGTIGIATMFGGLVTSTVAGTEGQYFNDNCLSPESSSLTADAANATQEDIARQIYSTAIASGMGENGALMAIYVGYAESGLTNHTHGDGSPGNTSRGVFQQLQGYAGAKAWSGQLPPTGQNADYFNETNAWGPSGWATRDPRMNPTSAAERFLDGLRIRLKTPLSTRMNVTPMTIGQFNSSELTNEEMVAWSNQVQGWRADAAGLDNNRRKVDPARAIYEKVRAEGVTVDPSQMVGSGFTGNGLLMIGDSLMQGLSMQTGNQQFGGPVKSFTEIGIGPSEAVAAFNGDALTPNGADWSSAFKNAPSRVYVSLGTNKIGSPALFKKNIDAVMALAGQNRTVYWNTLVYPSVTKYNSILMEATKKYPNLKLVDVVDYVQSNPDEIDDRSLHFTANGYEGLWDVAKAAMGGFEDGNIVVSADANPCSDLGGPNATAQVVIGSDGCPQTAPDAGLLDESDKIGIAEICKQAVAQAPTPQAAAAIKWALSHLDIPYACTTGKPQGSGQWIGASGKNYGSQGSARVGPEFYDCSSFVSAAYNETSGLGIRANTTYNMRKGNSAHYESHALKERMAGDLVVENTNGASGGHVVMYLGTIHGREWRVHTNACGSVSKIERFSPTGFDFANVARPIPASKAEQEDLVTRLGL